VAQRFKNVYQFKITLKDSKPPIWRRIQVPESYSFWDLHVAIQDAMGWMDYHLHLFTIPSAGSPGYIEIGIPEGNEYLKSVQEKIKDYISLEHPKLTYRYDFGDDWVHSVVLEKILPREPQQEYPLCVAGRMACPPEDCGGIDEYYRSMDILKDPQNEEFDFIADWFGKDYDPKQFDPRKIVFDDPSERRKMSGL